MLPFTLIDRGASIGAFMTTSRRIRRWCSGAMVAVCAVATAVSVAPAASAAMSVTVAADGSGNYVTVQAAIDSVAPNNGVPITITIKPGTYRGTVTIPANKPYLTLAGAGGSAGQVVIVEGHAAGQAKSGGGTYGTSGSASVFINANDTTIKNLTMANDFNEAANALDAEQAVAVNTSGDRVQFDNVRVLGNQDTLLVNAPSASAIRRLYVRNSYVEGDVDFIFGRGTMVFQNGTVHSLTRGSSSNNGYITAAATDINNKFGFLFWGTTLTSNAAARTVYLGRPWHPGGDVNARGQVLYRGVTMGAHIRNDPWTDMSGFSWKTARFAEYSSTGAGAVVNADRPQLSASTVTQFTPTAYLAGADAWNPIR
jgi:pectin methylesterase-like acyl-CoA thioesterase